MTHVFWQHLCTVLTRLAHYFLVMQVAPMAFNVLVTTYEYIMRDRAKLAKIDWRYIIIDEAQVGGWGPCFTEVSPRFDQAQRRESHGSG